MYSIRNKTAECSIEMNEVAMYGWNERLKGCDSPNSVGTQST